MEKPLIRPAQTADLEVVYSMVCELEDQKLDHQAFEHIFKSNLESTDTFYLVAETDWKVVGFISLHLQKILHHTGTVAEVQEFFVQPEHRSQGLGRALFERAKAIAEEHQAKNFEVSCSLTREKSHKFYESEGLNKTHFKFTEQL